MGLSTKQVSSDGLDWGQSLLHSGSLELPKPPLLPPARRQPLQQQSEPLPCPRCGSTNTKFCYYNNYNKSQPRHFCRSCKRHWTKGGTLRNVPVGGGRKNKRLKTSNATAAATSTTVATSTSSRNDTHMGIQSHQLSQTFPRTLGDQKNMSEILALINPPPASSSSLPLLQNQTTTPPPFNFSSLGSFENNPSSIFCYNFTGGLVSNPMEDTTGLIPSNSIASEPWQVLPTTSSVMDMPSHWNWDDIDSLVSTEINIPWDDHDSEIKPL